MSTSANNTETSKKPIIAIDIDEVLAEFLPGLCEFHNELYDHMTLTPDSFHTIQFDKVWGGTIQECDEKITAFYESPHFREKLRPVPSAYESLLVLKEIFTLHVVTARSTDIHSTTTEWIALHFPNVFTSIHFGNHYSKTGVKRSKAQICKEIGAVLLVDDNLVYALQCLKEGVPCVLFGDYAWNQPSSIASHLNTLGQSNATLSAPTEDYSIVEFTDREAFSTNYGAISSHANTKDHLIVTRVHTWTTAVDAILHTLGIEADIDTLRTRVQKVEEKESVQRLGIAVIQMTSSNSKEENYGACASLVKQALADHPNTELVCLPECCLFIGSSSAETAAAAEPIFSRMETTAAATKSTFSGGSAPISSLYKSSVNSEGYIFKLCGLARNYGVWLSVGGFPELIGEKEEEEEVDQREQQQQQHQQMYNTHVIIDPQGAIVFPVYRKIHLFDHAPSNLFESRLTKAGTELVVVNIGLWRVGLSVCYDIRFAAMFEALCRPKIHTQTETDDTCTSVEDRGAEVVLVPSAFMQTTGAAHWEVLLRARAIENQVYVVAAAQSGQHNANRASHGHSMIIDPWGTIIAHISDEGSGICYAELDRNRLLDVRDAMPTQFHKKPELYHV